MSQPEHIPHVTDCFKSVEIDKMSKQIDDLHKVFYRGNGVPPMTVRIDRLEQSHETSKWLSRSAIGAGITAIVIAFIKAHTK